MRTMQQWFDEYGESHLNPTNKLIHWICVPLIFLTVVGLLSLVKIPGIENSNSGVGPYIHLGTVILLLGLLFYLRLSFKIMLGMLLISSLVLYILKLVNLSFLENAWMVYFIIFVLAWIGQFIGHHIEGKKPSFLKDLQFLLIGPGWLLSHCYQKIGLNY